MNAPDPEDAVVLDDEEKRVTCTADTKIVQAANFRVLKEDHTLGNLLRHELLRDSNVRFAGYRMPHPLENVMELKVQTSGASNPIKAVLSSLDTLISEINTIENRFKASTIVCPSPSSLPVRASHVPSPHLLPSSTRCRIHSHAELAPDNAAREGCVRTFPPLRF